MSEDPINATALGLLLDRPTGAKIWGASAIAGYLGVSVDTVYRLAQEPDCPITRPSGRYFAYQRELNAWLRTKPDRKPE